jgi:hypothetical protein
MRLLWLMPLFAVQRHTYAVGWWLCMALLIPFHS